MGKPNELVERYEQTRRTAQVASTWKLKVWSNWARFRLKQTGRELIRIQVLALENELNHRPHQDARGQRRPTRP